MGKGMLFVAVIGLWLSSVAMSAEATDFECANNQLMAQRG